MKTSKINQYFPLLIIALFFLSACGDSENIKDTKDVSIDVIESKYSAAGLQSVFFEGYAVNINDRQTLSLGLNNITGQIDRDWDSFRTMGACPEVKVVSKENNRGSGSYKATVAVDYGVSCEKGGVYYAGKLFLSMAAKPDKDHMRATYNTKCTDFYSDKLRLKCNGNIKTTFELSKSNFENQNISNRVIISHSTSDLSIESYPQKLNITASAIEAEIGSINFGNANVQQIHIRNWKSSGVSDGNKTYQIEMIKEVIFKSCSRKGLVPVQGAVKLTFDNVNCTLDFGNGACDLKFTISNGKAVRELSFKNYSMLRRLLGI